MPDPIFHSAEEKSHSELRDQYREENRERVHALLTPYIITRDGKTISTRFLTDSIVQSFEERALQLDQDFGIPAVPQRLAARFTALAEETAEFDEHWGKVALPEGAGIDRDGPPLDCPIEELTEEEQVAYVAHAISESRGSK